jgi:ubiquinone/menaquinone biosynthesis C-methylase UbiE
MADRIAERATLDFVLALRRRWADTLYPQLRREFDARNNDRVAGDLETLVPVVRGLPTYPWFSWLERGSQKMLWRAVEDAVKGGSVENRARTRRADTATLTLDPDLELPDWYTDWDIHLQPGGIWSSDVAARVYELGAKLVMLGANDDYAFHHLFVASAVPCRDYRRIVDLGCGFGKSTWPLKEAFPQAEVIGIDLAAPCLRLAVERTSERGLAIEFRQANALDTRLEAGSADLVTSTMFLHEVPLAALPRVFEESSRLLAPGGALEFLDFQPTGDPFRDLAMIEHGTRNNEPYMAPMMAADLVSMARAAGLANARWSAFDERGAGRLPTLAWPTRTEWHFPWAVLHAEKPR